MKDKPDDKVIGKTGIGMEQITSLKVMEVRPVKVDWLDLAMRFIVPIKNVDKNGTK